MASPKHAPVKKKDFTPFVEWGRAGGKIGGKARAKKLSPQRRVEIAKKASSARRKKISPERRREIALKANKARWKK